MPEFLIDFAKDLNQKSKKLIKDYEDKETNKLYKGHFKNYWEAYTLSDQLPKNRVLAVDGSQGRAPMENGGIFYVVRALAIEKDERHKEVFADFNYSNERNFGNFLGRLMEWTEHLATIKGIKGEFDGYVLLDGSIYGRLAHLPLEFNLLNSKGFMIDYFDTLIELLTLCKERRIPIIGVSKESQTSFFREFLIKEILKGEIPDERLRKRIISKTLDSRRVGLKEAQKTGNDTVVKLIKELINRKPDSLLIQNNVDSSGYTSPLILGGSQRWQRSIKEIDRDPRAYVISQFPMSSENDEFLRKAQDVVKQLKDLPAIVSFHLLPKAIDTPMRIDIPAWVFESDDSNYADLKLKHVGWPRPIDVDLTEVLNLLSSGYCGLENYNIWLSHVDSEVKLKRKIFEDLYLNKFEEIIGKHSTSRGYRRVKYP